MEINENNHLFNNADSDLTSITHSQNMKRINKIEFKIISEDQVEMLSVVDITVKTLHDMKSRIPVSNGPLDLKLGTSNSSNKCQTCHDDLQTCPGHWGKINLVVPVFHIGLLQSTLNILNCICKNCSKCLLTDEKKIILYDTKKYKDKIREECRKVKRCPYCNSVNGIVKKINFRIYHEVKNITKIKVEQTSNKLNILTSFKTENIINTNGNTNKFEELSPVIVSKLFENIPKEDYSYLRLKQDARDLLIHKVLVPPSCIRPSVDMGDQGFNEDDITVKLSEIVNINQLLKQNIEKGTSLQSMNEDWDFLQLQISLFINSDLPTINNLPGTISPIKGIVQRIKGKHGRFRMHLSGKRVDFSGRTVISPDPNLSIEQVGIPIEIAKEMTFPEKVNENNIDWLRGLVENGTKKYPGANYVIYEDGRKLFLKYARKKKINVGDIVERHMIDDDIVLFNRQPSLHRLSIMAHKVKVHENKTFRFNICNCAPYNADFDGDEMNIHFPQNYDAKAEISSLMSIRNNICSPRNNEPLISPTQDLITGMFLLTSKETFFTYDRFYQLLCYIQTKEKSELFGRIKLKPCIIYPTRLFSGKQLFEQIVKLSLDNSKRITLKVKNRAPEYKKKPINLIKSKSEFKEDEFLINENFKNELLNNSEPREFFMFRNSYIYGRLDKSIIGSDNRVGSIIYRALLCSKNSAIKLMNSISKLSVRFLAERGFSIGLDDVFLTEGVMKSKNEIINKNISKVNEILKVPENVQEKGQENPQEKGQENAQENAQEKGQENVPENVQEKGQENAEEKGQENPQENAEEKGQENNKNKKLVKTSNVENSKKLLSINEEMEVSSYLNKIRELCGGVCISNLRETNSPIIMQECGSKGSKINVSQMIACVGQQIISGKRISDGMINRTLPHFNLYDNSPSARGFVFNSFFTGLTSYEYFFHAVSGREGLVDTVVKTADTGYMQRRLMKALEGLSIQYDTTLRNTYNDIIQYKFGEDGIDTLHFEEEILENIFISVDYEEEKEKENYNGKVFEQKFFDKTTGESFERNFENNFEKNFEKKTSYSSSNLKENLMRIKNKKFQFDIQNFLIEKSNKKFIRPEVFKRFFRKIELYLEKAEIEPGTAIGAITGQSIGEPGTQMTLKTFHFAGVASMNITLGVPRLKEIINASANISTPIINLKDISSAEVATEIQFIVEKLYFKDICKSIETLVGDFGIKLIFKIDISTFPSTFIDIIIEKIRAKHLIMLTEYDTLVIQIKNPKEGTLFNLERLKKSILNIQISGYKDSRGVYIKKNKNEKNPSEKNYSVIIEGNNYLEVLGTKHVNPNTTLTNDIICIYKTLGIEAARASIINEIKYTMGSHGIKIDYRHLMLLSDTMTNKGEVLGITRFGISKMRDSTLMLASFEQTADYLFKAAVEGKEDIVSGVSESIILGKMVGLGTGSMEILMKK